MIRSHLMLMVALAVAAMACAGPGPQSRPADSAAVPGQQSTRTLVAAIRDEPANIALNPFSQPGQATYLIKRTFNAQLSYVDNEAAAHPYLAEGLPQLNRDSWRVFPDGRMETTWRLKPGLTWHDGTALSAEDFAFSFRVYSTPELGNSGSPPFAALEGVTAPDDHTIVLRWRNLYPGAATMYEHNREFPALPRHIIEAPFQQNSADAFINLPYWTHEYVGLGPYRLERWEAGQFLEASAFDGHALGRPKIPRVRLMFIGDDNTVLASLLAGEIQLTGDAGARLSQVPILKQEWVPSGVGAVHLHFNQWRAVYIQYRPEFLEQRALLDRRVRTALFHAMDRQAVSESVYGGEAPVGDFLLPPLGELGRAADRAVLKYPYDPRRSEQLMIEAGYARSSDGVFASLAGGRVGFEVLTQSASDNNAEIAIIADGWKQAGFGAEQRLLSGPAARAPDVLAVFPGTLINSTSASLGLVNDFRSTSIPNRDNRWNGSNRGGWNNAEYTALAETLATTLDPQQRVDQMGRLARIFSEELPALTLFYRSVVFAHPTTLTGLTNTPPDSSVPWNMHEWELRS
jgi:peptide/nickel transport system substrate-binding protein